MTVTLLHAVQLRAAVEAELERLLTRGKDAHISDRAVFELRHFIAWCILSCDVVPSCCSEELPAAVARFIRDCAHLPCAEKEAQRRREIQAALVMARLQTEAGPLSYVSIQRRITAIACLLKATHDIHIRKDARVRLALKAAIVACRPAGLVFSPLTSQEIGAVLSQSQGSLATARDCALLLCWKASGESLRQLVYSNESSVRAAVERCDDPRLRAQALKALNHWLAVGCVSAGPVFRSIRARGRVGERLTKFQLEQIVAKHRMAAKPGAAVDHAKPLAALAI